MRKSLMLPVSAIIFLILEMLGSWVVPFDRIGQATYPPPTTSPTVLLTPMVYLPSSTIDYLQPPAAPSYYITNNSTLFELGYSLGLHDRNTPGIQDNLVILDYGYPAKQGDEYGVFLVFDQSGIFYSTSNIISSAIDFAAGYYYGTGDDIYDHLRMVIGVNSCCDENTLAFFQGHGYAWGEAVSSISSGISLYSSQVDIVGGSDIEMEFNDPYATTQWLDNYKSASTCIPISDISTEGCFYNFGNLTISISGTSCATSRTSPWSACDVWYVSWGAQKNYKRFARPLPEIYVRYNPVYPQYPWGLNATAWKDLSIFSATQMSAGKMYFVGTLTQRAECGEECNSGNNFPWEGYQLLFDALASNPITHMNIRWSTDITTQP